MAEVHLASATGIEGFEKLVVIKRILPQYATDRTFVSMFLDEARLAATLHHPNVVQVFDIGSDNGYYYFAMEYVQGEDVRALLSRAQKAKKPIPLGCAVAIVLDVCRGLHYAHQRRDAMGRPLGIVHRDVTPSNVIVTRDGSSKLLDFGVAKAASHTTETVVGSLKGKISYMSPEQCRGEPLDRRSDVFALGILLFELTTGSKLYKGDSDMATLHKISTQDAPSPKTRRADYPEGLERIVMRALARGLDRRYPTAMELQRDLETFAREQQLSTSTLDVAELLDELFPLPPALLPTGAPAGVMGTGTPAVVPARADAAAVGTRMMAPSKVMPAPPVLPDGAVAPAPGVRAVARRDDEPSVLVVDFIDDEALEPDLDSPDGPPSAQLEPSGLLPLHDHEHEHEHAAGHGDEAKTISKPSRPGVKPVTARAPSMTAALPASAMAAVRSVTAAEKRGRGLLVAACALLLLGGGAVVGMLSRGGGHAVPPTPSAAPVAPVQGAPSAAMPAPTPAPVPARVPAAAETPAPPPPSVVATPTPTPTPTAPKAAPAAPAAAAPNAASRPDAGPQKHHPHRGAQTPSTAPQHGPNWDPDSPELPGL